MFSEDGDEKQGKLKEFAKEHPSKRNVKELYKLNERMAKEKKGKE